MQFAVEITEPVTDEIMDAFVDKDADEVTFVVTGKIFAMGTDDFISEAFRKAGILDELVAGGIVDEDEIRW